MKNGQRILLRTAVLVVFVSLSAAGDLFANDAFRAKIEADWLLQESHFNRSIESSEAIHELLERADEVIERLGEEELVPEDILDKVRDRFDEVDSKAIPALSDTERRDLYLSLRWELRDLLFRNSLLANKPILFVKRERFVCQMLHEYLSYFYRHSGICGGGIYLLKDPGRSFEIEDLTDGKLPLGTISTMSLSYDAKTIYFAYADLSKFTDGTKPIKRTGEGFGDYSADYVTNFMKEEEGKFHLYKMDLATREITQLTTGCDDDFDPVELPDGGIVFMSTRRGGFGRCHGSWEPLAVHTLHRLDPDGKITCLSWHETNEWQPSITHDGRIIYCRWDYVDRDAARHHGLWLSNPDGTGAVSLFGNYTVAICALYQPKSIPGSNKIMFVAGAHHLDVGGPLVILDPQLVHYDPGKSEDTLDCIERLTPELPFPETDEDTPDFRCDQYYFSPFPLSEDFYLTAYSHESIGGMQYAHSPNTTGKTGLYYRDRFGCLELILEDEIFSCQYPIPVEATPVPPVIPSSLPKNGEKPTTGTFMLSDVYESLTPLPKDRPIKELRIFQLLPKFPDHRSNHPRIGYANSENARLLVGTIPVETDGSAHFTAPAERPLYFQAVDAEGRAVQTMRSEVYLQPGENRGCVGCHEQAQTIGKNAEVQPIASRRRPSTITPPPADMSPISYPRLIQPILDRNCVSCHAGQEGQPIPNLTGGVRGHYTESYLGLRPSVRFYEWGQNNIRYLSSLPGMCGADMSPLTKILDDENHVGHVSLSEEERRTIYLWLDANAPFYGVYDRAEQAKQQEGKKVSLPVIQ
jgi:hypothetical protein